MSTNASIAADIAEMNRLMKVYATFDAESLIAKLLNAEIDRLSDVIEAALKVETPDLVTRLIPAGGMALTAEQVEDVRIVLGLNGSQDIKVVLDAQARLRALFPATEPAEEETKAEYPHRGLGDLTVLGPEIFTNGEVINWRGENFMRQQDPASSPVAPAPTETGPWMHADEIPNDVTVVTDRDKRTWKYSSRTDKWTHRSHGQTRWVYGYPDPCFAPFVAAEEG